MNFDSFSICLIWKKWITLCQVMIFAFVPLNISFLLWIYRFLLLYVRIYLYCIKLINFHITFLISVYISVSECTKMSSSYRITRKNIHFSGMEFPWWNMHYTVWVINVQVMCVLTVQMIKLTKLVTKNNRHDQIDGNE